MSEGGERTLAPTTKRRRDAAQEGDVLRPRELGTAVAVLCGAAWLKFAGPWLYNLLSDDLRRGLAFDRGVLLEFAPGRMLAEAAMGVLAPVLLLGGLVAVAVVGSQMLFGEGRVVPGNLAPKAQRINPLAGLKRMFGPTGWIELGKSMAKAVLLGTIAWFWGKTHLASLMAMGGGRLTFQVAGAWDALISLLFALAAGLVVVALIDFPIQLIRYLGRLRMSHQDMRDETKESEGSPEKKAMIRQRQRQLAMGGMQRALREAQFVITNPSHFAVALAYDPDKAAAPIVLAKARNEAALAMRELAAELAVPTLEYPALARSVFFTTRENQVIREELYGAVAAVLAFVLALKRGEPVESPTIEIPVTLRFDAEGVHNPALQS